jgi:hypothetical protein
MPKPKTTTSTKPRRFDLDIEQLLHINGAISTLLKQAHMLIGRHEFPESFSALATLSRTFENELETNLLRAYDRAGTEQS